jgi:methylglutaconyl-CoA hydratase
MTETTTQPLVITEELKQGITLLTLNRPDRRNALNIPLLQALSDAIKTAEKNKQRVVILSGAGKVFCAGLDLKEATDPKQAHLSAEQVAETLKTLYYSPVVTIAAAHGAAIAGGAGLLAACDLAIATPDCQLGYPETRRGLVAGLVMTFLIRQVGDRIARRLLLTGDLINGDEALTAGLLNGVHRQETLLQTAIALAKEVVKGAPRATAHTKELLDSMHPPTASDDIELALSHHMQARQSDEAEEGIRAFLEKREPSWSVS